MVFAFVDFASVSLYGEMRQSLREESMRCKEVLTTKYQLTATDVAATVSHIGLVTAGNNGIEGEDNCEEGFLKMEGFLYFKTMKFWDHGA